MAGQTEMEDHVFLKPAGNLCPKLPCRQISMNQRMDPLILLTDVQGC